ncbi:MAG: flagellar hook protein FlgE [Ectobacillus sp.]
MIQSLYTSISGMKTYQEALSVTSNNIANSQTIGYKKQKALFDDLMYRNAAGSKGDEKYAGTNSKSIGSGVKLSGVSTDYSSGVLTLTGGKTDVALEGAGFFLLGDINGSNFEYTRKGTFNLSADYRLINGEGKYVLGYPADPATGEIDFAKQPQAINVPLGEAQGGIKTDKATVAGNIPVGEDGITKMQFPVFDEAGNKLTLELSFEKGNALNGIPANSYRLTAKVGVQDVAVTANGNAPVDIPFKANGELDANALPPITIGFKGGINLDYKGLTNYPTEKTLKSLDVNGRQASIPIDYSITDGGYVMVKYSDGSVKTAAQLTVATFPNEKGLMKTGNGNYVEGPSSGNVNVGVSGQNGAGAVRGGATEGSNVDLAAEFVDLMVYQRGFQGNSKVIKVSDEVLNDIVNLIR